MKGFTPQNNFTLSQHGNSW